MPTVKNGKVSVNIRLDEEIYNKWKQIACKNGIMNMSEFIRTMVNKGIDKNE